MVISLCSYRLASASLILAICQMWNPAACRGDACGKPGAVLHLLGQGESHAKAGDDWILNHIPVSTQSFGEQVTLSGRMPQSIVLLPSACSGTAWEGSTREGSQRLFVVLCSFSASLGSMGSQTEDTIRPHPLQVGLRLQHLRYQGKEAGGCLHRVQKDAEQSMQQWVKALLDNTLALTFDWSDKCDGGETVQTCRDQASLIRLAC